MSFDFSGIRIGVPPETRPTHPIEVFKRLTLRGSVENIWQPQTEAVQGWYDARADHDIAIEMHTGGGKTLAGLLVGQASVNEQRRPGVYVCPTIQLVEQTRARAEECGIETAMYVNREWQDREVFDGARGLCITTYAAVFNSRAKLAREPVRPGIFIFDDAHVAGEEVRSQFTLRIGSAHEAFQPVLDLVRRHFTGPHEAAKLQAIGRGDNLPLLYLPQYEMRRVAGALRNLLLRCKVDERGAATWYPWGHIHTRLETCCMLLTSTAIEISPPVPPIHGLWCMEQGIRRVYLTATMPSAAEFARTFGVGDMSVIRPGGKSGTAQRLFIFSPGESDPSQRVAAGALVQDKKAAVIVPSFKDADLWRGQGTVFERDDRQDVIDRFARSAPPNRLVLAARYHGIDLPGDACRVLVLDGLPRGSGLLDRFLAEGLQAETLRTTQTAVRLVQAIGRIFRSNTDHGAVILCGSELQAWLRQPVHQAFFPPLLQQQVRLGIELRNNVDDGRTGYNDLLAGVLTGHKSWDEMYTRYIDAFAADAAPASPSWLTGFSAREHAAYRMLWDGNASGAAQVYTTLAEDAEPHDRDLAAWYHHWAGAAHEEAAQPELAAAAYLEAANRRGTLGRPKLDTEGLLQSRNVATPSAQAVAVVTEWTQDPARIAGRVREIGATLGAAEITAAQAHDTLTALGRFLGLEAWRPDTPANGKTGPDVAWRPQKGRGIVGLEAKTEKRLTAEYRKKDDVGQAHDHVQWAEDNFPGEQFYARWVGPLLPVSKESHPPKSLRVIEPVAFADLANRLLTVYELLAAGHAEAPEVTVERYLAALGLRWPGCVLSLPSTLATDLQRDPNEDEAPPAATAPAAVPNL